MADETVTVDEERGEEEHIHVRVDPDLKHQVRVTAAKNDQTISAYIRRLLRDEINDE
jgi:predicted HicB family RNase H-like nuclease